MKITEVKVFPVNEARLKAYVTMVIDGCFVIRDIKVISGNNGLFVAMPSKRRKDGSYKDIAHPLNQSTRAEVEEVILKTYLAEVRDGRAVDAGDAAQAQADADESAPKDGKNEESEANPAQP